MEQISEDLCNECKNHMANDKNQNRATMSHFTVRFEHDKCMEALLQAGTDVNCADDSTFTPLMAAADEGYVDGVQRLLRAGADVNRKSKDNKTALILASLKGHDKCVELLLNAGADVNVWTSGRYKHFTALHSAVDCTNIRMGTDVNRSEENETELTPARFEGPDRCIELLLNAGADVNALTSGPCDHLTALHSAVGSRNITHIKLLLKKAADVNKEGYESSREYKGVTALCLAAGDGFDEAVKLLIEAGADVNKVPRNGTTPLMEIIQHYEGDASERTKCIELLLEAGADVNTECLDYTALHLALDHGFHEAVDLLIRAGADVNKALRKGITPLVAASSVWGHPVNNIVKCLKLLIQAGADVNATTPEGSALTAASENAFDEGVQLLIQAGDDVNKFCPDIDKMPLMVATANGYPKTTGLLLQAGADVNLVNSDGNTALMVFSFIGLGHDSMMSHFNCLKLLLRSGVKINTRNSQSETTLQCLVRAFQRVRGFYRTRADIFRLLFAAGETLDGITDEKIQIYLIFGDDKLSLKHLSREAIRKHLLNLDPHTHLFSRVPRLGLPSLVTEYLLYDISLDSDIDDNSNENNEVDDHSNDKSM